MSSGAQLTSCKLYVLRRSAILDAQFGANTRASEITSYVNGVLLQELKESTRAVPDACLEPVLVLIPSATYAGKIFKPDDSPIQYATSQGIDLTQTALDSSGNSFLLIYRSSTSSVLSNRMINVQSPFSLFHQPALVRVSPADSKQDARQIVIDLAASLVSHIPLLQTVFATSGNEFSFRAVYPNTETWLHSQMSLMEHRFDPSVAFLELVSMKTITSKWKEMVVGNDSRPERVGYLFKQSSGGKEAKSTSKPSRPTKTEKKVRRQTESTLSPASVAEEGARNAKSLRKRSKRWFVLKGLFLAYFKTRDETAPSSVIPLDYYIVRLSDDIKKGERAMSLDKCAPVFPGGMLEDLVLATEPENENELRLWFQSTNGKCANTALNRVFGMPLLHQLCHNQHGYVKRTQLGSEDPLFYLPPFLTQCTKFLASDGIDQEGLFRISHTTTELLAYREFFDTGAEINLGGTSPHCVAGLIKAWLRELPEPIIPNDMYHTFLQTVATTKDKELKRERVLGLLEHIPLHSLRTLSHIASFMKQIVSYTVLNRMTYQSLAIVLAPCILRHADPLMGDDESSDYNPLQLLKETPMINEVVFIVFENCDAVAQAVERISDSLVPASSSPTAAGASSKSASSPVSASAFDSLPSPTPFSPSASSGSLSSAPSSIVDPRAIPFNPLKLPQVGRLGTTSHRPRTGSNGVIRSLNEDLPPLKEGQISIFTPSGITPTVTIEPSPRSLRASSPKWGRKHRNTTQWKGGAVGGGRVSGTTSPVPPMRDGDGNTTDEDAIAFSRRNSEDIIGHNLHLDASKFLSATGHPAHHGLETMSLPVSPRGGSHTAWSQPVSPDPEARLIAMIMTLQQSQDQLVSRVLELEERLAREIALRTALEVKLANLAPNAS